MENPYKAVKQYIVPFLFPPTFIILALVLPLYGQTSRSLSLESIVNTALTVDSFAVKTVFVYLAWSLLWLKVPCKQVYGPRTSFGQIPAYQGNGLEYYFGSVLVISIVYAMRPDLAVDAYVRMPELVAVLNMFTLVVCALLTLKGFLFPTYREVTEAPPELFSGMAYKFWCGAELHPSIWGVDVKQLIICRFGLMMWQQLIIAFFVASTHMNGFSLPLFYNLVLQSVYLLKFFAWEDGYFHTIDIIEDRASYYLCWGTGVWVPVLYTWSTYYLVERRSALGHFGSSLICFAGLACIGLNYLVDLERQIFRRTGKSFMPGSTTYMKVAYIDDSGTKHDSTLLTSGLWGKARHLNYTFEIGLTACWCLMGWGHGTIAPYLYLYFLTVLLVHRFYRDQVRCRKKYGDKQWDAYCAAVPYKLVPYII